MVIGIIPNASSTETLLNNLSEADFDLKTVSVIMSDPKQQKAIAKDAGPLKGTTAAGLSARLTQLGVSKADAQAYAAAVNNGGVLVAIAPPKGSEQAAVQMLNDYNPQMVKVV